MATFNTAIYNAQNEARANPSRLSEANIASGEVEFAIVPYALAGTEEESTSDTIRLCLLPGGAIPIPELSKVVCAGDPGSALVVDIGTAENPDGWADGITLSSGGSVECTSGTFPSWTIQKTPLVPDAGSGNAVIYATVATGTALTAEVVLHFVLAWKRAR